ncbi:hypothetical protein ABTG19_18945, partial [Acinetobacter baumannii]
IRRSYSKNATAIRKYISRQLSLPPMQAPILHTIRGQQIWLSAARVLYWENKKTLIVSDTHFGKTGHFRKNGIVVPQNVYKEDLQRFFD